jgi:ABC-type methionine transport system permease subunit
MSQVIMLNVAAALPFAPLILLVIPLDQLIIDSAKKLMNL